MHCNEDEPARFTLADVLSRAHAKSLGHVYSDFLQSSDVRRKEEVNEGKEDTSDEADGVNLLVTSVANQFKAHRVRKTEEHQFSRTK